MKEEQERILKYIGELYAKRRLHQNKNVSLTNTEREDIIKAGKEIRKIRERKGISLAQLAQLTELTESYLAGIELGEADPYMTEIYDITKALGIQLSALFNYKEK